MITSMIQPMITGMITSMIRSSVTGRWFISLDPVANSYYEISSSITLAGDFEIEFLVSGADFSVTNTYTGLSSTSIDFFRSTSSTLFNVRNTASGQRSISSLTALEDAKLNIVMLKRTSGSVSVQVNSGGFGTPSAGWTGDVIIDVIGQKGNSDYFDGIIANVSINDIAAAEVTTFRLDQPTLNTESSVEGNNTAEYNNISAGIREFFTLVDDGVNWLGADELVVDGSFNIGTGWTNNGTFPYDTFDSTAGNAHAVATTGGTQVFTGGGAFTIESGLTYRMSANVNRASGATIVYKVASAPLGATLMTLSTIVYDGSLSSQDLTASSGSGGAVIQLQTAANVDYTFDNASVKRIIEIA